MTTWTRAQIDQVTRLRASAEVDNARSPAALQDAKNDTRERLFRRLRRDAHHALAVELHAADLVLHEQVVPERDRTVMTAAWAPRTNEVELRGGPSDGDVLKFAKVGEPLLVPPPPTTVWERTDLTEVEVCRYELSGWQETERRWVYAPV